MFCRKCGKEISDDTKFCPECGAPVNPQSMPLRSASQFQQAVPAKANRPFYKRWYFWVIAVFASLIVIGAISDNEEETSDSQSQGTIAQSARPASTPRPTATPKASPLDDDIIDVDISKCHVTYLWHEVVENMAGDTCLAVYYEFTNNGDDSKAFLYTIGDKAFQDGIELESSWFHVSDESHDSSAEIKPGVAITVCEAYVLRNLESDVELEVEEWISLKNAPADKMTVSIK